jgi:hypothetical protein
LLFSQGGTVHRVRMIKAHVSAYRENAKKRPPAMMSDATMLRGRSEYIAARRSRSAMATFGELIITTG